MNERLLQYIWNHALFDAQALKDVDGHPIQIIKTGTLNTHAGPDFTDARIRINNVELVGNIELHILSSDWLAHKHQHQAAYENIILHVVFINDLQRSLGNFHTLELGPHIPAKIIQQYQNLLSHSADIPCNNNIHLVPELNVKHWLSRMLIERWEQKSADWQILFEQTNYDWRQTLYIKLFENFGFKVNAAPMLQLAHSIPLKIIEKHQSTAHDIAAMLYGQARLLPISSEEPYVQLLIEQYTFLQHKYGIKPIHASWKFLRMRPVNFPTLRIAQLAALLSSSHELFSKLLQIDTAKAAYSIFKVAAPTFWDEHYHFNKGTNRVSVKTLGKSAIDNIIINTIAPFQFFYGIVMGDQRYKEQSLNLISSIPAEHNHIISAWQALKIPVENAHHSQALLHLFNHYCQHRQCLQCAIGHHILRQ